MGTLASELQPIAAGLAGQPRVYVDANLPRTVVGVMRHDLHWDVLFVLEDPDLRRAADREHFRRALDFGRTLVTLDSDFLDDRRFPLEASPGVILVSAPDERGIVRLLRHIDRALLRAPGAPPMPLRGRKVTVTPDVASRPPR